MKRTPREDFDESVIALFDAHNPDALSLEAHIQRTLHQFRLTNVYDVKDILVEAYARGVRLTASGVSIAIPIAWMRRTSYNVVREFRRDMDRIGYKNLDREPCPRPDALSDMLMTNDLRAMRSAFKRLEPEERDILRLRVLERLSWREVGACLVAAEGKEYSTGALRQRGFRALKRLREIYEEERHNIHLDWDDSNPN